MEKFYYAIVKGIQMTPDKKGITEVITKEKSIIAENEDIAFLAAKGLHPKKTFIMGDRRHEPKVMTAKEYKKLILLRKN